MRVTHKIVLKCPETKNCNILVNTTLHFIEKVFFFFKGDVLLQQHNAKHCTFDNNHERTLS